MRAAVIAGILIVVIAAVYLSRRAATTAAQSGGNSPLQVNQSHSQRRATPSGEILTDPQDPEFAERVLPVVREFFATLEHAGVNPLKGELPYNSIRIHHGRNGMTCRFLLGESWTATAYVSPEYSGILHFGQRGPDNPFRAISHANTNALIRLSQNAITMPQPEAERIINRISEALSVDRSKFEKPEFYPEKMFDYDLGMYSVQYRTKGSDPINQLNYPMSFTIRATSPTSAVLVSYLYDGKGGR
ncbi:MAG: hypothetical protein L0Y58_02475 [Verrucomicrobia subdivision 3 bacterium]|nr:hypothetical protein [Limisphaerales bacterium]